MNSSGAIKIVAVNLKDDYYWTPYISEGQYFHRENVNDMVVGDQTNVKELYEFDDTYKKIGTISRKDSDVVYQTYTFHFKIYLLYLKRYYRE